MLEPTQQEIIIKPLTAELKFQGNDYRKDPYCVLYFGQKKLITKPNHISSDKVPTWSDTFRCVHNNEKILRVLVYEKNYLTKDDLYGEGAISISQLLKSGKQQVWIDLKTLENKDAGKICLETEYRKLV